MSQISDQIIKLATGFLPQVVDKASLWAEARRDAPVMIELLSVELETNLNILSTIDSSAEQWAPVCIKVASKLETEYIIAAFAPGQASAKIQAMLKGIEIVLADDQATGEPERLPVSRALRSILVRTRAVQALASLGEKPEGMVAVQLATRLRNLQKSMDGARKALKSLAGE